MLTELWPEAAKPQFIDFPEATDATLVAAAKRGDRTAFDVLVARYERRLFFTALRVTRNREDAEDVVQQSFQKAFVHLQRFEERSSFSTWLTRIVFNEALMLKRSSRKFAEISLDESSEEDRKNPMLEIADAGPSPESRFSQIEHNELLFSAINGLKPGIRAAIEICDLDESSVAETANALDISVTAVKSRVLRGRRVLRNKLKGHMSATKPSMQSQIS